MYTRKLGLQIMTSHLVGDKFCRRRQHSKDVGDFLYKVAKKIETHTPELKLNPELCAFLGYVHDIGYSISPEKHELHTVDLLVGEWIPKEIAKKAMHGSYIPVGIEGILLSAADMSVSTGDPLPVDRRALEIIDRITSHPEIPDKKKKEIIASVQRDLPRFKRYHEIMFTLAGVKSVYDF